MRASLHDAGDLDAIIVSTAKERASVPSNGRLDDVSITLFFLDFHLSRPYL